MKMSRNLLLISNSTLHGTTYLQHCEKDMTNMMHDCKNIVFIPYARPNGISYAEYTSLARKAFQDMGYELYGIHEEEDPKESITRSDAIFIGGGNTFVLLTMLYANEILDTIRKEVFQGKPYIGTSAGSNVAGATIQTTNDMPIMYPPSFDALHLVPFIINPHYVDPDPTSKHMGETRETRIKEYHAFNDGTVVALREGSMLEIIGDRVTLKGITNARIYQKHKEPLEYQPGDRLDFLLSNEYMKQKKYPHE